MTEDSPTAQDIENASRRRQIADRQAAEYEAAEQLAMAALGPGWTPWMKLSLVDSDHRRTGDTVPHATAIKVYSGDSALTERSLFLRRLPDGVIQVTEQYEDLFPELDESHPTRTLEIGGRHVPAPRWTVYWSGLEGGYDPHTAEQLAARRQRREGRALERQADANPLFSEQILTGEMKPQKRRMR